MINLEIPRKLTPLVEQARTVADNVFRPISRKYDLLEHQYPKELDLLAALIDGMNDGGGAASANNLGTTNDSPTVENEASKNGANMAAVLGMAELSRGDVGLALSIPRQGLGNAALGAVGTNAQKEKFGKKWIAMAITEPDAGSDSAKIRATARLDTDGDAYVINGEKIFVTAGDRCDAVVVWASLDLSLGRAAIKAFLVEKNTPGVSVVRLEEKLGIRGSDTATLMFENVRVPKENILGSPEIDTKKSFAGVMKTFDNTRPVVAAMAVGVARASLDRTRVIFHSAGLDASADLERLEGEYEASRLLMLKAAWMADNRIPNSLEASMSKAKAGRMANEVTLRCIELVGAQAYSENDLLEKWGRDSKILDIFEGTQQIQMLVIARLVLGKTSAELK